MFKSLRSLNIVAECRGMHLGLWSCPPFLFVIIGTINISAILFSYSIASRHIDDPAVIVVIASAVAVSIFIIGHSVVRGFAKIAEANRFKSEFIAMLSHQLRSPLSIFKWSLDALARQPAFKNDAGESAASYLAALSENAEKMIGIINILLEVSRIESGNMILRRDPVKLEVLTDEVVHSFSAYARASNIALDYASPLRIAPAIGDAEKIKMVIENLIDNAIRYSSGGGRVVVTVRPYDSSMVEWRIEDGGRGIPAGEQRHIFKKFFRSAGAASRETRGWGLGLYIARYIVNALGGEIGFRSVEGQGALFWFRLPICHK